MIVFSVLGYDSQRNHTLGACFSRSAANTRTRSKINTVQIINIIMFKSCLYLVDRKLQVQTELPSNHVNILERSSNTSTSTSVCYHHTHTLSSHSRDSRYWDQNKGVNWCETACRGKSTQVCNRLTRAVQGLDPDDTRV